MEEKEVLNHSMGKTLPRNFPSRVLATSSRKMPEKRLPDTFSAG